MIMRRVQELDRASLTIEQKLGLLLCTTLAYGEDDVEDALALVRNHALGGIWLQPRHPNFAERIRRVLDAADYPIIVIGDSEEGYGDYKIPSRSP